MMSEPIREAQQDRGHFIATVLLLPMTLACFSMLPRTLGLAPGYLAAFVTYWTYCLAHGWRLKQSPLRPLYRTPARDRRNVLLSLLCFVPATGAFVVAFLPAASKLSAMLWLVLIVAALTNGVVEEFYWRAAFISRYGRSATRALLVPTVLFGLWHVSLLAAPGVEYHGGALALVGGSSVMGLLWGYTAFSQQRVLVPTLAHVLTNFFAFAGLLVDNFAG